MPAWVADEAIWEKAKAKAREGKGVDEAEGDKFYALVTAIYKKMGGRMQKHANLNKSELSLLLILKSYVRPHTRRLADGRVIQVGGYDDKRTRRADEHPAPRVAANSRREIGQFARTGTNRVKLNEAGDWVRYDSGEALSPEANGELKKLGIPPAWGAGVHYNPDPESDLRVIAVDNKNRRKYFYTEQHKSESKDAIFSRLEAFTKAAPAIIREAAAMLDKSDNAAVIYLIARTGIRIGSNTDTQAKRKAYGASTLLAGHVVSEGNRVVLKFPAKSGKDAYKVIEDPVLVALLRSKVVGKAPGDRLWNVREDGVRTLLKQISGNTDFIVKDFRTWHGTEYAKKLIAKVSNPLNEREKRQKQRIIATAVSQRLGNTPAMALHSYISPKVWEKWEQKK